MRNSILFFLILFLSLAAVSHAGVTSNQDPKKTSKRVQSEAGLNIPNWGLAVDAVYDSKLDNLIPGYKIVNVVVSNRGANVISLDAQKDRWKIKDAIGKNHVAINHLRYVNVALWDNLPNGLREKLEYPHVVRVGHSAEIDLFFPKTVDLANFREILWESAYFKKEFNLYTSMEKNLDTDVPEKREVPDSPAYQKSLEKYE